MSKPWVRTIIPIDPNIDTDDAQTIAEELLDYIIERSKAGKGADGKPFPGYSEAYKKSLAFKIAGKSPGKVDLTLSGEMLDSLKVLAVQRGKIVIGYDEGDPVNGKAEGNIKGTYGTDVEDASKARDYMSVSANEVKKVIEDLDLFPMEFQNQIRKEAALDSRKIISEMIFDFEDDAA